ncbi:MAG: HD-GYP domain-containing protein [Alphaproteobacteria bacterium]
MEQHQLTPPHTARARIHYLSAMIILAIYGVQVCPFLESLTPAQLVVPIVVAMVMQYFLRAPLIAKFVLTAPYHIQTMRTFTVEYGLFIASGVALTAFNTIVYGFPVGSGLKVIVGLATLGFFASLDLALESQRNLVDFFCRSGQRMQVDANYFPLTGKLGILAAVSIVFILAVVFLVIVKDLDWLKNVGTTVTLKEAQLYILVEIVFVVGMILGHVLNVIYSYSRNLKGFLESENGVLSKAANGDLDGFVPVGTNDEFGIMAIHTNEMVKGLRESAEEVRLTRDVSILTLASLAETRDNETGAHILRTQRYVKALAVHLKDHPRFTDALTDENIELLYKSAPLHDIGKVGIPDNILLKPDKLTVEEFEVMKGHAQLGADALRIAEKELGSNSFLSFAREISRTHHEKWDGSGYPAGIAGDDIPVSGRLMALADVYDALISERVYKAAFSHEQARGIIVDGDGKHFDPDIVQAFLAIETEFQTIAAEFSDASYGEDEAEAMTA